MQDDRTEIVVPSLGVSKLKNQVEAPRPNRNSQISYETAASHVRMYTSLRNSKCFYTKYHR